MDNATIRVGIVGVNYGAVTHLPAYRATEGFEVVAVCTSRPETAAAAAREHGVAGAFHDYDEMAASPDVDLVDIVTRPSLHHPMAMAALRHGKHVLCEAPLALSVSEATEMATAARQKGVVAAVDMQSRYAPGLRELRRLVAEGYLGRVEFVDVTAFYPTFTLPGPLAASAWCAQRSNGASSLRVHGLHSADIVRWCFGEITLLGGVSTNLRDRWAAPGGDVPVDSDDHAALLGQLEGGGIVTIRSSWVAQHATGWRLAAHGSDGTLVATADGHTAHFPVSLAGGRSGEPLEPISVAAPDGPVAPEAPTYAFSQLLARLRAAIRGGAEMEPTFEDGLALLRLAEAVER